MKAPEEDRLKDATSYQKPKPPLNLLCRKCYLAGHWTQDCPNFDEVVE
jgi:hypothetical protein